MFYLFICIPPTTTLQKKRKKKNKKKSTLQFPLYCPRQLSTSCSPAPVQHTKGGQWESGRAPSAWLMFLYHLLCTSAGVKNLHGDMTLLWTRQQHKRLQIVACIHRRCWFISVLHDRQVTELFLVHSTSPVAACDDSKLGSVDRILSMVLLSVS